MEGVRETISDHLRTEKAIVRELLAEFIGTFFLLLIGTAANVQCVLGGGNITSAHIAWGIGFAFAVFLAANASGGHLNPAISLTAYFLGNLSFIRFLCYSLVQIIGAFCGTAITFLSHYDNIFDYDHGIRNVVGANATAGLFATFPASQMTTVGSLFDQIIGTAILSGMVCLITDRRQNVPSPMQPILAGMVMTMIAMTHGSNGGFAINPARDFGPRLFLLCVGYGWSVFSSYNYYFWIPIVGPLIGALLGAWLYKLFIGLHGLNEQLDIISGPPYPKIDKGYRVSSIIPVK
uniref:Aquaporin-10 n=1 Tax=Ascaris suum TaxID=6253 RepID=F1L9B8_ASCSU